MLILFICDIGLEAHPVFVLETVYLKFSTDGACGHMLMAKVLLCNCMCSSGQGEQLGAGSP